MSTKERPTPETDALEERLYRHDFGSNHATTERLKLARSLEQQRDELKEALVWAEAWIVATSGEVPEIRECGTYRRMLANAQEVLARNNDKKEDK
jgi:hypothetical protein